MLWWFACKQVLTKKEFVVGRRKKGHFNPTGLLLDMYQTSAVEFLCNSFFPTCQVRVVRFCVSCPSPPLLPPLLARLLHSSSLTSTTSIHAKCSLPDLYRDHLHQVFPAGPQLRAATPSVPCRTSTTSSHAKCTLMDLNHEQPGQVFLPDINHDHPHQVLPAGLQPRPPTPSVTGRTSTATIQAQFSLPDLNHNHTMSEKMPERMPEKLPEKKPHRMS